MLHDTNWHPGPRELLKAIDREVFCITEFFSGSLEDWGVAVIRRKL